MRLILSLLLLFAITSCKNNNKVDVSDIKVDLKTFRFEKDLFAIDTNRIDQGIQQLIQKYPTFAENFFSTILNTDPRWGADTSAIYIKQFITAYQKVYDTSTKVFSDFNKYEKQLEDAVRHLKYYFPAYKHPENIITYIGPLDGFGDILTEEAFVIGLHHHLGQDFSLYKSMYVLETYPEYISKRFEPDYIMINSITNIINDMYPEKYDDKSLVIQMVEKGKRLYALEKILPDAEPYRLIGYTKKQLDESYDHERVIWDLFVQNNLLRTLDYNVIKNYVGESPKTMELGEASPGNIGSFSGWQVVKKYMDANPDKPLPELMATDAEVIFQQAKYKP